MSTCRVRPSTIQCGSILEISEKQVPVELHNQGDSEQGCRNGSLER